MRLFAICAAVALTLGLSAAQAQPGRPTPYWASIASGEAMMRTGPGRNYPGTWLYRRRDLPIQVVRVHGDWRQVRDPEGTVGWMLARLLSAERTAIVRGDSPQPLREAPDAASPVRFRAEPNVVGRISRCAGGWCNLLVRGRGGFIRANQLWGVDPGETVR